MKLKRFTCLILFLATAIPVSLFAQDTRETIPNTQNPASQITYDSQGRPIKKPTQKDSLIHRNPLEDSITISYRFFDSTRSEHLDSSITDFYKWFPFSYKNVDLGNLGTASEPIIFSPNMQPGWDAGFHAYDLYRFTVKDTRFFNTTRPYAELGYLLGGKGEQMINVLFTKNSKRNFNFTFQYRFINSPGSYKNQNSSHNNIRINTYYTSRNKRYGNYFIFINNKLRASDNGGLQDEGKLDSLSLNDPFELFTRLGNNAQSSRNFFSTNISTGTEYDENIFLFRQYYDIGQKDSLVVDSTTYQLFYPRLRFQHTISYQSQKFIFSDINPVDSNYTKYFNYLVNSPTIRFQDNWKNLVNDFSIITYPQKNNFNQFFKLGATHEWIQGGAENLPVVQYNNIIANVEYRNRTKNQQWDLIARGKLYAAGSYAGDYEAYVAMQKQLAHSTAFFQLGLQNVNRSPAAVFNNQVSSFPVVAPNFNKENNTRIFANLHFNKINLDLTGEYFILGNYIYFDNFYEAKQSAGLLNVLHAAAEKKFKIAKHWNFYSEVHLQKTTANAPIEIPLIFTRNRFAFEGNFFTNLYLSTGVEVIYNSPYNADNYSPLNGHFIVQDTATLHNRPEINLYLGMRIKSFKGFIRLENLNTLNIQNNFSFTNVNFSAPHYAERGLWIRFGIWWNFVN